MGWFLIRPLEWPLEQPYTLLMNENVFKLQDYSEFLFCLEGFQFLWRFFFYVTARIVYEGEPNVSHNVEDEVLICVSSVFMIFFFNLLPSWFIVVDGLCCDLLYYIVLPLNPKLKGLNGNGEFMMCNCVKFVSSPF